MRKGGRGIAGGEEMERGKGGRRGARGGGIWE